MQPLLGGVGSDAAQRRGLARGVRLPAQAAEDVPHVLVDGAVWRVVPEQEHGIVAGPLGNHVAVRGDEAAARVEIKGVAEAGIGHDLELACPGRGRDAHDAGVGAGTASAVADFEHGRERVTELRRRAEGGFGCDGLRGVDGR